MRREGERVKIKHPWYMTLLQYYILILLVPMFVILFLGLLSIYLVRSEVITANRIIVEQFRQEISTKLEEFQQYNIFVQQEESLISLELKDGRLDALQRYQLIQMNKNLSKVILTNHMVADYLIYMPDQMLIYSNGYYYVNDMEDYRMEALFTEIPDYQNLFEEMYHSALVTIYQDQQIKDILYIDTMKGALYKNKGYQFILRLDLERWNQFISQIFSSSEFTFAAIIDTDTQEPVYVSDPVFYQTLQDKGIRTFENGEYLSVQHHKDYYCYGLEGEKNKLKYVLLMNTGEIFKATDKMNMLIMASFLFAIGTTILIFRVIRLKEYNSIATTIALLDEEKLSASGNNIFGSFYSIISKLLTDKKSLERSMHNSEEYLQRYFLMKLLMQKTEDRKAYADILESYHVCFAYSCIRVLLFYHVPQLEEIDTQSVCEEFHLAVKREMEAKYGADKEMYSLWMNGMLVLILNYDSLAEENSVLINKLYHFRKKLQKEGIICTLSREKENFQQLKNAYDEAMEAMEQCLLETINFKEYHEYPKSPYTKHGKYYQYEANFKRALEEGSFRNAEVILNNMFVLLKESFFSNPYDVKCKLYGIFNIIMGELSVRPEYSEELRFAYDKLKEEQSIPGLEQNIEDILHFFADTEDREDANKNGFNQRVEAYVEKNYAQVSLSVGMIADTFGLEMSSLSKRFKKEWGINISDYIQMVRLKKAKEMLPNDKYTIKMIAEQCGYVNSDVFIRAFKRYEGITPGKYRSRIKIGHCPEGKHPENQSIRDDRENNDGVEK